MPFLENVTRGRGVPPERLAAVAEHYLHFGGVSPINAQNRDLVEAVRTDLSAHGIGLPVYWGNRNWHPFVADTVQDDGGRWDPAGGGLRDVGLRVLLLVPAVPGRPRGGTSLTVGAGAPELHKLRQFFDHPGFIEPQVDAVRAALAAIDRRRTGPRPGCCSPRTRSRPRWRRRRAGRRPLRRQLEAAATLIAASAAARTRLGAGLPEPQRSAVRALARAGPVGAAGRAGAPKG